MLRRSPLIHLLFALLLVFGQQQAASHALEHDLEHLRSGEQAPGHPETFCAKCLVFAHLDHVSDVAVPIFDAPRHAPSIDRPWRHRDPAVASVARYDSRAPPRFS